MNTRKCIAVFTISLLALAPLFGGAAARGSEREGVKEGANEVHSLIDVTTEKGEMT